MSEAPEPEKYHGGYDPSNPPNDPDVCDDCHRTLDECACDDESPCGNPQEYGDGSAD